MTNAAQDTEKKKRGNPEWYKNMPSANPVGRPKTLNKDKKTNRECRADELLSLVRKLKPHQSRAVQAAVSILDNKESSESGKLKASAMILQLYKDLIKDLYDQRYDNDEAEEVQKSNAPAFSLHMLPVDKKD